MLGLYTKLCRNKPWNRSKIIKIRADTKNSLLNLSQLNIKLVETITISRSFSSLFYTAFIYLFSCAVLYSYSKFIKIFLTSYECLFLRWWNKNIQTNINATQK